MLYNTTYEGYWWLPGEPEKSIPGTVRIDEEGAITLSTLGPLIDDPWLNREDIDAITGVTADGKKATLLDCQCGNWKLAFPGFQRQSFHARAFVLGVGLDDSDSLTFKSFSFRFTDIEAWAGKTGISIERHTEPFQLNIGYKFPDVRAAEIPDGYTLKVDFSVNQHNASISEKAWITLQPDEDRSLWQYWETTVRLRDFFSLAVGRPVFVTEITGKSELEKLSVEGRDVFPGVRIHLAHLSQPRDRKPIRQSEILIPLVAIEDHIGDTLTAWRERAEVIEPALNLYFGTLYEHVIHVQRHVLFLAQAAETYHRRTSDETQLSVDDHKRRIESILDSVPENYRSWLDAKLTYSNELSLRSRLKRLFEHFRDLLGEYIDRDYFAHKVVAIRNYLTHYDPENRTQAAEGTTEYLDLIYKLRTLLEACFLHELNFSNEEIKEILKVKIRDRRETIAGG